MIVKQLIVTVLLLFTEKCCGSIQFSQTVYDIMVDREPTNSSEVIGRAEIMNALAAKYLCYWTNISGSLNQVISVDPETGDVCLSTAIIVNSQSFEVAVYASTGGCSPHSEAEATIRVHVSCMLGSHLWNGVPKCPNTYVPCATKMCDFGLRSINMEGNVRSGEEFPKPLVIPLAYRIKSRQYGCLTKAIVTCQSTEGISLQNIIVTGIGADMMCPVGQNQSAAPLSQDEFIEMNLDELCALGGAESWIDIGFHAVALNATTEGTVECITTAGPVLINSSRIQTALLLPETETLLSRQKRSLITPEIKLPANIGSFELNRPKNVTIAFHVPCQEFVPHLTITVGCLEKSRSEKAQCTLSGSSVTLPEELVVLSPIVTELDTFDEHQINKMIAVIQKTNLKNTGTKHTGVCVIKLVVAVRIADCAEAHIDGPINLSIIIFTEEKIETKLDMRIDRHGTEKADLNVKIEANKTDVYPGDTIELKTTLAQTERSQLECKKLKLRLHHGALVKSVGHPHRNTNIFETLKTGDRFTELMTRGMYFGEKWNLTSTIHFMDPFEFPHGVELRMLSFTLEVACLTYEHVPVAHTPVFFGIANVMLHRARGHYKALITPKLNGFRSCQVTWSFWKQLKDGAKRAGCLKTTGLPKTISNEQPITILTGPLTRMYYIQFTFTAPGPGNFIGRIYMTLEARDYLFLQEGTFFMQSGNVYSCIFRVPIVARGLRVIPLKLAGPQEHPITDMQLYGQIQDNDHEQFDPCLPQYTAKKKWPSTVPESMRIHNRSFLHADRYFIICHPVLDLHGLQMPRMKCTRVVDDHGLRWMDLGPFVSQVVTYQSEDKILFGIGPQEETLVMSKDWGVTWVGINHFGYHVYGLMKTHTNATYFPWESTDNFNEDLIGTSCTAYVSGPWNICYNGLYYQNVRKGVWDDDCPTGSN